MTKIDSLLTELERVNLSRLKKGLNRPSLFFSELNRLYNHQTNSTRYNPDGIDIFKEDWDNLVILDSCRYDKFKQLMELPGKLEWRISRGSTSPEFIRGNFQDKILDDTMYVSANGWFGILQEKINSDVYYFNFIERDAMNGMTSRPETVSAAARNAIEEYPNKRLIVHYMQPHQPYLGGTGEKIDHKAGLPKTVKENDVSHEQIVQAYQENLELVLEEVELLLNDIEGKSVVTADHGELLGEQEHPIPVKRYGHPEGVYVDELVKVPWHVYQNGSRRKIHASKLEEGSNTANKRDIESHLKSLGYKE